MFAQLIKSRIKPGKEQDAQELPQELDADNAASTPWVAITTSVNRNDPGEYYTLVVFESEEKARETNEAPNRPSASNA